MRDLQLDTNVVSEYARAKRPEKQHQGLCRVERASTESLAKLNAHALLNP